MYKRQPPSRASGRDLTSNRPRLCREAAESIALMSLFTACLLYTSYWMDPESGMMATGWLENGGSWYYLDPSSGAMATGTAVIDGTRYIFDDSGACADFVDE